MGLFDVTRNTVSNWIKDGLRPSDGGVPYVFNGAEVRRFHDAKRTTGSTPLRIGQFKCFSCKERVFPDTKSVEKRVLENGGFAVRAVCFACAAIVTKRVNEIDCDKILDCANTNTSLEALDEVKDQIPAGIGNDSDLIDEVCYFNNDRILHEWRQFAGRWSVKTVSAKIAAIRRFEAFCSGKDFSKVTKKDVSQFREHLKSSAESFGEDRLSVSTVRHLVSHLKSFFEWLIVQDGFHDLDRTLPGYFELPKKFSASALSGEIRPVPTENEASQMIELAPAETIKQRRDRAMVAIAFLAALRADTITSLRVRHLDADHQIVVQDARRSRTKNGKSLRIKFFPVPPIFVEVVVAWKEELIGLGYSDDDALFPDDKHFAGTIDRSQSPSISPMSSTHAVSSAFRSASRGINKNFSPHSAKHFIGQLRLKICQSLEASKAWSVNMGHENEDVTQRYYENITEERVSEIFEAFHSGEGVPVEDMELMLRYHEHELVPGTPEFERAKRLVLERQNRTL
ncbi:tyrosine-type recombinase/integrase [Litoreibacter albidus]|uniref:tyrosine-type recombinase/integrase n=1 Tax=Litoreibacter albidus TaxID=670155 RepID=UPI0037356238